jgi:hypothetical protein
MLCRPEQYFDTALERHTQAQFLRRNGHHSLALYVFGLSVECMLRAFQPAGAVFDERHDIAELLKGSEWKLSDKQRRRLHAAINEVHEVWHNSFRFADEERLRSLLKARKLDRGIHSVHRGADFLKVRCEELDAACSEIIDIGRKAWQRR